MGFQATGFNRGVERSASDRGQLACFSDAVGKWSGCHVDFTDVAESVSAAVFAVSRTA